MAKRYELAPPKPMTDIQAVRENWRELRQLVKTIRPGNTDSFRRVNQRLGYFVVYTAGALIGEIDRLETEVTQLRAELKTAAAKPPPLSLPGHIRMTEVVDEMELI